MNYLHRSTTIPPDLAMSRAAEFFGARLAPTEDGPRRRRFASPLGRLTVTVEAEGGHYTLVTLATDQPAESELDKLAKRFLTLLHGDQHRTHCPIGAY